jgi:hypothetical protein
MKCWLIERHDGGVFQRPHWYHEEPSGWHWWTKDANLAKQFASKEEAEAYPAYLMVASDPTISVTEHLFFSDSEFQAAAPGSALEALRAILAKPYGCIYCDSGVQRLPPKFPHARKDQGHEADCGFGMAEVILEAKS